MVITSFSTLLLLFIGCTHAAQILLAGDSWTGGSREFIEAFEKNGDRRSIQNIGVGGTTCRGWANSGPLGWLQRLINHVRDPEVEYVWFICGGNDAINNLLGCTPMDECIEKLIEESKANVRIIANAVYEANPRAKIAGFGYDVFPFGGEGYLHCSVFAVGMFPGCIGSPNVPLCVNTEFLKLQGVYDWAAEEFDNFDSTNLLGTLQAAGGVPESAIGTPNLNFYSPYPSFAADCIHPSRTGYASLMDAYYDHYWGRHKSRHHGNATYTVDQDDREEELMERQRTLLRTYLKGLEALNMTKN